MIDALGIITRHPLTLAQVAIVYAVAHLGGVVPYNNRHIRTISGISRHATAKTAIAGLVEMGILTRNGASIGIVSGADADTEEGAKKGILNGKTSKEGGSKEHPLNQGTKSAGADCALREVGSVLMDGTLTASVGVPTDGFATICAVHQMRRPELVDAYCKAWNERAEANAPKDGSEISAEGASGQIAFARWLFPKANKLQPTARWISERWKQRQERRSK